MSTFPEPLLDRATRLLDAARTQGLRIAAAESCTGGLVAALLTEIAGSSDVFDRGFVTYSNEAKHELLGVPVSLITKHGAVSEEVARAMAEGAIRVSRADIAVSITGIAGPGGGTLLKPVGTVHFACARESGETIHRHMTYPDSGRAGIRMASVETALFMLEAAVGI